MCLCKGAGGIKQVHSWGIAFNPCPDSHCQHDKEKARQELDQLRADFEELSKLQGESA